MGASVPDHFEEMWRAIEPLGRAERSGGYFRQPFASAERELDAWFVEQATARGLRLETDRVRQPDRLVGRGHRPGRRHRVAPRLGARRWCVRRAARRRHGARGGRGAARAGLPAGAADRGVGVRRGGGFPLRARLPRVAARDRSRRPGRRPAACATGTAYGSTRRWRRRASTPRIPKPWLGSEQFACFVELHVEQGRDLVDRGAAIGVASRIWPHGRYRFDISGSPNHAGTTRMEDRQDPMLTYAMTALAANKQARVAGQRATFGRVDTQPELHQLGAVGGDRLDGRAVRDRRGAGRARRDHHPPGRGARVPRRHAADRDRRVGVRGRRLRPGARSPDRDRPRGRATGRSCRRRRATTPGSCRRQGSRARCCSSATRPGCRTRRPSTPRCRTAWPASTPWPRRCRGWPRERPHVVPARAGVGRRGRPGRRAGGDRGRAVHVRHTGGGFPSLVRGCNP